MNLDALARPLALTIVGAPACLVLLLGGACLVERPLSERAASRAAGLANGVGLMATLALTVLLLGQGRGRLAVDVGQWVALAEYQFHVKLLADGLSLALAALSFLLCGVVGAFAARYLHREPGYQRFFVLYAVFMLGMAVTSLAGTIETLFAGWELVGLSSALLVAFFHERPAPVYNGLRVWVVYRLADAALLTAAVVLHHVRGHGDFEVLLGSAAWPSGRTLLAAPHCLTVGLLLVGTAAGKSALVPFSGWLPRAMEGPTPSSAVFYGALSVHLGAFLLLRFAPLLERAPLVCWLVVALGLITASFAALAARVQADIKSALAFGSLTQVGLIVAEIGLGLRWLALAHLIGHACLRTLQFVRAPNLIHDYHTLENAVGEHPDHLGRSSPAPGPVRLWWYRFALERGYLDSLLTDYVARPVLSVLRFCDRMEHAWTNFLAGSRSLPSDRLLPPPLHMDQPS